MQKLIMVWLVGAAVFALSPQYSPSAAQLTDEDLMGAQAKIDRLQAILDEEDEDLQDDEDFEGDQEEPENQGDTEDDVEDQDDQEDSSGEMASSGESGTPT
jgi:hypothetical protein